MANLGPYFEDLGIDGGMQARLLVSLAVAGAIGKYLFGVLADRIALKLGLWAAIALTATALLIFSVEPRLPVVFCGGIVMGLATGGIMPVWGAMVGAIFGVASFGRAMGLMTPVIALFVTPGFALAGAIRDATGSYVLAFQLFIAVLIAAALLLVALRIPATIEFGETLGEATEG